MTNPKIIQGGMGIGVSSHHLARSVSRHGYLGTVSGTGTEVLMARILQQGDLGGHWRRALSHFPIPNIVDGILAKYYIEGGKPKEASFINTPMFSIKPTPALIEMTVCANFAQIWLAKENHQGLIAVNLMTKLPMPLVYSIFGCMLAGVDYILIGAGIPMQIPSVLDGLENMKPVTYQLDIINAHKDHSHRMIFDPKSIMGETIQSLPRPKFIPIITSDILAKRMCQRLPGKIDGFVIEGPSAGGHNAPPRGQTQLDSDGQIVYGPRDEPKLDIIHDLGLPFWLAGSTVSVAGRDRLWASRAVGIQVGTIFALCDESGFDDGYRRELRRLAFGGALKVFDDPLASPTGFPFKIAHLPDSLASLDEYEQRPRICNVGHLREIYLKENGSLGYRCPSEPVEDYLRKGGQIESTVNRKCLCNALAANIGIGQVQPRTGYFEKPLITLGRDYGFLKSLMKTEDDSYTASEAINLLELIFQIK